MSDRFSRHGPWLVALVLVSLNLRPVITTVPPLALDLAADLRLSAVATGALTTVPVACMGLFAPVAAWAARVTGESTVLAAGLVFIAVGGALRGFGGAPGLFAATAIAGIGIAVTGTLLPAQVRRRAPGRVGVVTGLYTAALIAGALLGSAAAQPVASWLGVPAQAALAVWAAPAVVALGAWLVVSRKPAAGPAPAPAAAPAPAPARLPWRDRSAWLGAAFMGAQSLLFYATLAWLAASNVDAGMSSHNAGLLLGLFSATQMLTALAVPALADRGGDLRWWFAVSVGTATAGLFLVALVPHAFPAAPWLWSAIIGLGMGGNLSLGLVAITHIAPNPQATAAYSGMAFFVGYLFAATGPALLGLLTDLTGGYRLPFLVLAVLGVGTIAIGVATGSRARSPHEPG
jgi:MFS transporter, CP family, cyanate transporter